MKDINYKIKKYIKKLKTSTSIEQMELYNERLRNYYRKKASEDITKKIDK